MTNTPNNQWEQEFEEFWNKLYHGDSWHTEGQEKAETRRFITTLLEQQQEEFIKTLEEIAEIGNVGWGYQCQEYAEKKIEAIRSANHD